jgi:S-adenosylmethionine synthetase
MGVRSGARIDLTVVCAVVSRHVADMAAYVAAREAVREIVDAAARRSSTLEVGVTINAADDPVRGDVYLASPGPPRRPVTTARWHAATASAASSRHTAR